MNMKSFIALLNVITACVGLPIWLYVLHYILTAIEASEFVWFLFWIYVPVSIVGRILGAQLEKGE